MAESFGIGALAARTGRTVHTIRWYEAQGLIPGVERDPGGRRRYSDAHVGWLELIDRLRLTGMSVAQMRGYTTMVKRGPTTLRQRRQILRDHRRRIEATIADWAAALRLIDQKIDFYGECLTSGRRPVRDPVTRRRRQA